MVSESVGIYLYDGSIIVYILDGRLKSVNANKIFIHEHEEKLKETCAHRQRSMSFKTKENVEPSNIEREDKRQRQMIKDCAKIATTDFAGLRGFDRLENMLLIKVRHIVRKPSPDTSFQRKLESIRGPRQVADK